MTHTLEELDKKLAERYGGYASYKRDDDTTTDTYGDSPSDEMDRLLDAYCKPESRVLDIGCGAGFTLCRLAPKVTEIYGFEQEPDLLEATRLRAAHLGLGHVQCVLGNVADAADVKSGLPDDTFDVAFSRRGPNVVPAVLSKLKPNAIVIQELVQGTLGVKPLFGREPFLPVVGHNPHRLIAQYAELDLMSVSVKDYFFDQFFHDEAQLIRDLQAFLLWDWTMPDYPYDETRDHSALDTYIRYNTTPRGIKVTHRRSVYVFRRTHVARFPAVPEAKRKYTPYV